MCYDYKMENKEVKSLTYYIRFLIGIEVCFKWDLQWYVVSEALFLFTEIMSL